ncbi:MAG: hypothetical protein ABSH14_10535 [Verrucomicrobiia bacterium]
MSLSRPHLIADGPPRQSKVGLGSAQLCYDRIVGNGGSTWNGFYRTGCRAAFRSAEDFGDTDLRLVDLPAMTV